MDRFEGGAGGVADGGDDIGGIAACAGGRAPRADGRLVAVVAAVAVAVRLGNLPEFAGKTIVTVLPDAAERYLTSSLFEGMFDE